MNLNFVKVHSGITATELVDLIAVCELEKQNPRPSGFGYPGITLKDNSFILPVMKELADKAAADSKWKVKYDLGAGTGVNFLKFLVGDKLLPHHDMPLYELDENFVVKPIFDNRECIVSVVLNLNDDYEGGEFAFVDTKTNARQIIKLAAGEALIFLSHEGYNEVTNVRSGVKYQLAAFFCG